MLITIRHKLTIDFAEPVPRLLLHLLLTPQSGPSQGIIEWTLDFSAEARQVEMTDGFGNHALFVSLTGISEPLDIVLSGIVETISGNGVLGMPMGEPVPWLFHRVTPQTRVPASVWGKFRGEASQPDDQLGVLHSLMSRIHELHQAETAEESQDQGADTATGAAMLSQTQAEETESPSFLAPAQTFVGSARALGIPARLVSGYLVSDDVEIDSGPHFWAEAFLEGLGWVGFDPGLDICPTERYVRLAVGLDAGTAVPVRAYPPVGDGEIPVKTNEIAVAEGTSQ